MPKKMLFFSSSTLEFYLDKRDSKLTSRLRFMKFAFQLNERKRDEVEREKEMFQSLLSIQFFSIHLIVWIILVS